MHFNQNDARDYYHHCLDRSHIELYAKMGSCSIVSSGIYFRCRKGGIASNGKAFETGYYKTTAINADTKEKRVSYGKFHVLLRRENGEWKILMDQDAKEDADEARFLLAAPIE